MLHLRETLRIIVAFGLTAAAVVPIVARAQIDVAAVDQRITGLTAIYGRIAALAPACGLRDDDWADDLEADIILKAILPDVGKGDDEFQAAESKFANSRLDMAKTIALADLAGRGAATVCGTLRRDPQLRAADQMVTDGRKPHDWSGAGGKP